jgi:hypothetical protein
MNAIKGTVKNRQVHVEVPADWPEGCEVVIEPVAAAEGGGDGEDAATPEEIAARLALMDQLEPGWLSPEDDAAWRAALRVMATPGRGVECRTAFW